MKLNNKGFALTSIIYMLIVLFLLTMLLVLANLATRKVVLDKIKNDVKYNLNQGGLVAQKIYIVTFDPTLGQIDQTSKQVKYNEPYGELPTPTREGYKFIGWGERTYETYDFIRYYDESNTLRISPDTHYQNSENQIIEAGDILIFDVSFSNANIQSIDIDDKVLDSSKYSIENGRVYGKINIETSMLKSGITFLNFVDINYNSKPTNYTINKFMLIKSSNIVTLQTIVTKQENHTLYAMWEPLYTVTFDSNGGTLTDNTKYVSYNEPYGTLPTPTKEGYRFVGWAEQYQQLEYIESTGTQYIDTGLIANQDTGFEIDFTTNNALSTSEFGSIFGARTSSKNNEYQLTTYSSNNSYKGTLRYGNSNSYNAGFNNTTERQHMILKNKVYTGNSNESIQLDSTFETPVNLTIFGVNENGTVIQNGSLKLYSFKIYDGNTLVRDFVPSIRTNDDSIGLYDVQNNQFYTNSGTGSFIIPQTSKNYITDSTIVTKQENHTLYAIWEANS